MREVTVLLTAALHLKASTLIGPRGVLRLLPWDGVSKLPAVVGALWVLLTSSDGKLPGEELCCRIKADPASSNAHVIVVVDGDEADPQHVMEQVCADDYIVGPLNQKVLLSHFDQIARNQSQPSGGLLAAGDLTMDLQAYRVCWGDIPIHLSMIEFKILYLFMTKPGQLLRREMLLESIGRDGDDISLSTVTGWVGKLSRKLQTSGMPPVIRGFRGEGYRFYSPN